jgi:hypothetical protein
MTRQEAREILLLYRPGHSDPDDGSFEQALELTKHDPELAAWFEQHCEVQKTLAAAFRNIPVAEGLKEQIVSERKAHFWREKRRTVLALCSAVIAVSILWITISRNSPRQRPDDSFSNFRERMAGEVQRGYPPMDLVTNSLPEVRKYLASHQGHDNIIVPPPLAQSPTIGCKVLAWHGKTVSMICFNSGKKPSANPDLYLFVADSSDFQSVTNKNQPELNRILGLATASWKSGNKVYFLGGEGDEAFLNKYL